MHAASHVLIVTGASRGIGYSVANHLLSRRAGHRLVLVARTEAPLLDLQARYPERVAFLVGDMTDRNMGTQAVEMALDKFHSVDSLILNHATLGPVKPVSDGSVSEWKTAFDTNFFSGLQIIQAALPALRKRRGRIVWVSSSTSTKPYGSLGAYGATKAAVNNLVMMLGEEEEEVVTVAVRPGEVDTELQRQMREVHAHGGAMRVQDAMRFIDLAETGRLLAPDVPGRVIAEMGLSASRELSGKFVDWDAGFRAAWDCKTEE
ncbi:unnamed protein product [Zymoseptoria tritici ST99CH_1A5]|uniref:Ketoreductase domain-containing protein n=3 Tax=Zymoseptoria tritici TaxID=1047171 RepID=F9XEE5_ZYMTI|nr:uncharacterized protein MYCGRDRAFT_44154 [Zymoseptoria tritici IPO323]EGP86947.1 hypothetical protein MYCGRDRAFT_44154 [Zymoseptoria tritici IPO323]SMR53517.1 unnamed protein product [Zymoseptoria tritici ST99CH_1E4]SMY25084.1 unnamed protein product [Zymoseptoria tritici ST99CH_1A5]